MRETRTRPSASLVFGLGMLALFHVSLAWSADDADIDVHVRQAGRQVIVDVALAVEATATEVWHVLTDYDHMATFVSNLEVSKIVERDNNSLTVLQKGKASRGLLTFSFENVRQIVLTPYSEIRSRLISGDLEASEFTTRLVDHGASVGITNHGEFIPNVWVPPLIGPAMIAAETRKQFGQLRDEILRRKALAINDRR